MTVAHIKTIYEEHIKPLSALDRRRLLELLRREIEIGSSESRLSILSLEGLGAKIWAGIELQEYIDMLRNEWSYRP